MIVPLDEYVTTSQAADLAHVQPATIRQWARRGHLEPVRRPDGEVARHPDTGETMFRLLDVAKAEHSTRRRARRILARAA